MVDQHQLFEHRSSSGRRVRCHLSWPSKALASAAAAVRPWLRAEHLSTRCATCPSGLAIISRTDALVERVDAELVQGPTAGRAPAARAEPIGTRDMDSTPPAMATPYWLEITPMGREVHRLLR